MLQEPSIAPYYEIISGFLATFGLLLPVLAIVLSFVVGLYGRRLSGVIRVVLLFAIGFIASVHWLAPIVADYAPEIPALFVGLAAGCLVAVLSKMIYNLVYIGCIGFDVYNICFSALFFVEVTSLTQGNMYASLAVAAVAVLLALAVRKYLEMIITSAAGGLGVAFFMKSLFDYTVYLPYEATVSILAVGVLVAVPLFIYQYRQRIYYV